MSLEQLNHPTIGCRPQDVRAIEELHTGTLGLKPGRRPDSNVPGNGFHQVGHAVMHKRPLAGGAARQEAREQPPPLRDPWPGGRAQIFAVDATWDTAPASCLPLHQLFLNDPAGAKVELTFDMPEKA